LVRRCEIRGKTARPSPHPADTNVDVNRVVPQRPVAVTACHVVESPMV